MKTNNIFSIVIPSYNEEKSIPFFLKEYAKYADKYAFQLVLVNNGSFDNSATVIADLLATGDYPFVKLVTIPKNKGYGFGIYTGLLACDSDLIGWTHADLQTPVSDVFKAYDHYKKLSSSSENYFVKGHRKTRKLFPLFLTTGFSLYSWIRLGKLFDDVNGQPKLFPKELLEYYKVPVHGFAFDLYIQYLALKNKYRVFSFPVDFIDRQFGFSSWASTLKSRFKIIILYLQEISLIASYKKKR